MGLEPARIFRLKAGCPSCMASTANQDTIFFSLLLRRIVLWIAVGILNGQVDGIRIHTVCVTGKDANQLHHAPDKIESDLNRANAVPYLACVININ